MNKTRLPPLTALRAFEAAARLTSFQKAAEELNVTPAALSYQIKSLEGHAGVQLFRRMNRAVALTEAGRTLLPGVSEGFAALRMAWSRMRRATGTNSLTVTAGPAFTSKWLAPRLFRFAEHHDDIDLRFVASLRVLDFERDAVDVAIRFGTGADAEHFAEPLGDEWVTPMMVPSLADRVGRDPGMDGVPLIHDESMARFENAPDWRAWFLANGVRGREGGPRFSQADHALDYALEGGGALLGRASLAERDLKAGRLVAPFRTALPAPARYRFVCPKGTEDRPAIARFRDWVRAELTGLELLAREFTFLPLARIANAS